MNIRELLNHKVHQAMQAAGIPAEYSASLAPSKKAGFGDYQANGAMAAAKAMKANPRDLAQQILDNLDLSGIAEKLEVAGPGFINIHLADSWLAQQTTGLINDPKLGQEKVAQPQTVVVDYSSPNLAKEMHGGHLRSSIIGDALVRALEFQGHDVIRQNHVGDWGTQFGMLIAELEDQLEDGEVAEFALKDLEGFYQQSKKHFDEDEALPSVPATTSSNCNPVTSECWNCGRNSRKSPCSTAKTFISSSTSPLKKKTCAAKVPTTTICPKWSPN